VATPGVASFLSCWSKGGADWHRALPSRLRRTGANLAGTVWSALGGTPFDKSIRARFHFAMALALIGIALVAAITLASNLVLLQAFEHSVSEVNEEIAPSHRLETSLREAERLASLYVIARDASAPSKFSQVADQVDRQFHGISEYLAHHSHHGDDYQRILRALVAWQEARDAAQSAFQSPPDTQGAADAVSRMVAVLNPAYSLISEFHHHAEEEMAKELASGQNLVRWSLYATSVAVLLGALMLSLGAILLSRSILKPIARLREAADRLANNDFSYRVRLRNDADELGYLGNTINGAAASLQELYQELERRSTHDGLTGVLNRTALEERLSVECTSAERHERPLSLLMLDIDFFKRVNDTYGHQAGDRVLQNIARVLNETTRPGDVVARYGGEEFAIILPEADTDEAMAIAQRLREAVETSWFDAPGSMRIAVTVSLGCATRAAHGASPEELVHLADKSLYLAKQQGRNRVVSAHERSSAPPRESQQATAA